MKQNSLCASLKLNELLYYNFSTLRFIKFRKEYTEEDNFTPSKRSKKTHNQFFKSCDRKRFDVKFNIGDIYQRGKHNNIKTQHEYETKSLEYHCMSFQMSAVRSLDTVCPYLYYPHLSSPRAPHGTQLCCHVAEATELNNENIFLHMQKLGCLYPAP